MDPNALSSIGKFSRPLWPPVEDNNPPKDKKLRLLSSITMKKRRPATSIPPPISDEFSNVDERALGSMEMAVHCLALFAFHSGFPSSADPFGRPAFAELANPAYVAE
ncbi:hypothetical protein DPEC_G00375470 [Dallia pectoralis]|nr:hypothetical protein DPEC_G00375470 [Dallia pectoralis]